MIYVATGHRPDKLEGYTPSAQSILEDFAFHLVWSTLDEPSYFITGMAQGWDQAIAIACRRACIPYLAAVPCDGFEARWPKQAQDVYKNLLNDAIQIHVVSPGPYAIEKLQLRNQWMVDQATADTDKVVALWNGSKGGTRNCVQYAHFKKVAVLNVWDKWQAHPKLIH